MSGTLHQKSTSRAYPIRISLVVEILLPIILGMIAIIAHARFRMHLGIPGHHGLIFMALLIIARKTSKIKCSSLLFTIGVGSFLYIPFLGFKDPFVLFVYIWPGILFDLLYIPFKEKQYKVWYLAIIGGISYSSIPISRFIIGLLTGIFHKSVLSGLFMPWFAFFVFGLFGSLIGLGAFQVFKKFIK